MMVAEDQAYMVLPARAIGTPLTYLGSERNFQIGEWVRVPLGSGQCTGLILGAATKNPKFKLKYITDVLPLKPLQQDFINFLQQMADYTLANPGLILRMVLAGSERAMTLKPIPWLTKSQKQPSKLTKARQNILNAFDECPIWQKRDLMAHTGVSASVIAGLRGEDIIQETYRTPEALPKPDPDHHSIALNDDQKQAVKHLSTKLNTGFSTTLLEGVTGSGKTEVYFTIIANLLKQSDDQVLIMMPEIALTEAFINRFSVRFGCKPGVWHSGISEAQKGRLYRDVMNGSARVVLGARSALFLPFHSLALTIIDEEHDSAYKSEDRAIHHARDMAILRAKHEKACVILCSATPSLETYHNVVQKRYDHVYLGKRFAAQSLPSITLIDLRQTSLSSGHWISDELTKAMKVTLEQGEQVLLFLNRRGYAPMTLCRSCGFRFGCPTCTSWLVEHRAKAGRLCCHHCGYTQTKPANCPECGEAELLAYGSGIERIGEEAQNLFPEARVLVLSSDNKMNLETLQDNFHAIAEGKVNLIVGTQLIAKGHHFPKLGMVGVIDGDLGLAQADLRAAERSFQLLTQVVGRAGREEHLGRGYIQTLAPEHPVLQAFVSGDQEAFYQTEMQERDRFGWPPSGRLAALIISSPVQDAAASEARRLARTFPDQSKAQLLGPVEAPLFRVRNVFRYRMLIKTDRLTHHASFVKAWLNTAGAPPANVRIQIDIDPINFM